MAEDTRLVEAVRRGDLDALRHWLAMGIHPDDGFAIGLAAMTGQVEAMLILMEFGADIHIYNNSLLRSACLAGRMEVVKLLIAKGADVNAPRNIYGRKPLACAAFNDHGDVMRLLLKAGADARADRDYALETAVSLGHQSGVDILLAHIFRPESWQGRDAEELEKTSVQMIRQFQSQATLYPVYKAMAVDSIQRHGLVAYQAIRRQAARDHRITAAPPKKLRPL